MKHFFLFFFIAIITTSCSPQLLEDVQYGENYKHTKNKFERAGFTCKFAVIKIVNKSKESQTVMLNSGLVYTIPQKDKLVLPVNPGYNLVEDLYDRINLYCVPCNTYVHVYK